MRSFILIFLVLAATFHPAIGIAEECMEPSEDSPCETLKKDEIPKEPAFLIPLSLDQCGYLTFKPGLRIQARYVYDGHFHENDIYIPRLRIKAGGDLFKIAKYYSELKIDNTGRFQKDPRARVENAWIDFILCKDLLYLRVGLYDLPFSRDALTSDSKLLFMDRSLIKDALTGFGFADNTIGLLFHGRPWGGRLEYAVGIFDNEKFEQIGEFGPRYSRQLMPAGRIVYNALDPATPPDGYADYKASYLCQGRRLNIGVNAAGLGGAWIEERKHDFFAWGVDLFYNYYCFTFQAEYDWYRGKLKKGFGEDIYGYGWYVQSGYMFCPCWEFALRYQELEPDRRAVRSKLRWTSVGMNYYIREHHLKILTDYTLRRASGEGINAGLFQIQLQLDF